MPPDRTALAAGTASRFSQALETGAPLSSVGSAHPPSLERGKACLTCRRRRVKCDGARPVCARCSKSARAHGEDPSTFVCVYDHSVPKQKSAAAAPAASREAQAIAELAAQVAALKEQLGRNQGQPQQPHQPFASTSAHTLDADPATYLSSSDTTSTPYHLSTANGYPPSAAPSVEATSSSLMWTPSLQATAAAASQYDPMTGGSRPDLTDLATAASPLYQLPLPTMHWGALTHSSYPSDLPSPGLFERLVSVYFSKPHLATKLVDERRFRQSLIYLEMPSDPRSPSPCLLHAIVATAALLVPESFYLPHEPRYWGLKTSLSCHHAKLAERGLDAAFQRGRQLLQVVQASILCCFCAYTEARFGDTWLVSAICARLAVTVGLNNIRRSPPNSAAEASPAGASGRSGNHDDDGDGDGNRGVGGEPARTRNAHKRQRRMKEKSMLAPTSDREEIDERAAVFFFALATDTMTSAATGWAPAINEDDVTTLLPHPPGAEDTFDDPLSSPLYLHNPSFFTACPAHLTGSLQLYFKAYILLGRVTRFLQRAPEPVGSGYARDGDEDLRETPTFRSLERTISHFRQSIPRELTYAYYASHHGIENTPFLVFTILHVLTILLHEPFCLGPDIDAQDPSFQKCAAAAKAIVASVYELSGSSFEIGLLASFLNFLWTVAGRTLVRALALASRRNDLAAAAQLANDVKALIRAMQANKSRVGAVTALNLQRLLLHPFQVLAESFSGPSPVTDPSGARRYVQGTGGGSAGAGAGRLCPVETPGSANAAEEAERWGTVPEMPGQEEGHATTALAEAGGGGGGGGPGLDESSWAALLASGVVGTRTHPNTTADADADTDALLNFLNHSAHPWQSSGLWDLGALGSRP